MKIQRLTFVLSLTLLGACTVQESSSPEAAAPEQGLLAPEDAAIPTEAEAADAAAKAIDEKNADAELEKLKKELEGGH